METFLNAGMWGLILFGLVYAVGGALLDAYRDSQKKTELRFLLLEPNTEYRIEWFGTVFPNSLIDGDGWRKHFRCVQGSCIFCGPFDWSKDDEWLSAK